MTDAVQDLTRPSNAISIHEPHGFVALDMWAGDDLTVVNSARVSFDKISSYQYSTSDGREFADWDDAMDHEEDLAAKTGASDFNVIPDPPQYLIADDEGLLKYLMNNKHGTPFEMVWMRWHVKAPIFVFREWHRHRMASINEMSGRYVELKPEFYLPDDDHVRVQVGKPGHYTYEPASRTTALQCREELSDAYETVYKAYQLMLRNGIAKEIARACLPVGLYSEMYWATNLRGFLNFLSLRNHSRALQEIRDYAAAMEEVFAKEMPIAHKYFVENGRVAP